MTRPRKRIILGATAGGINNGTIWAHPDSGSQVDFAPQVHVAQTAERGKFDFFFIGEGLRLRERQGKIFEHEVIGRLDSLPLLAALSAVTTQIGLIATINATYNEPYELARQLASLDHLSGGRAGWNVVTSLDAFTGANFRRGGFLAYEDRYNRAAEFLAAARQLWDSWSPDAILADRGSGQYLAEPETGRLRHAGSQFDIAGFFNVPRSPQRWPVIVQAGASPTGREFAARGSDIIFFSQNDFTQAQQFYRDIQDRAARWGRPPGAVKLLPGGSFVLGDTENEAKDLYHEIATLQTSGQSTQLLFERIWNRDLSGYDPDGPLPDLDPDPGAPPVVEGGVALGPQALQIAAEWRAVAEQRGYSMRELATHFFGLSRQEIVGTPAQVADYIDSWVQQDAADGFILGAHLNPHGLAEFVDRVIPLLQERGSFHQEYDGGTLRENLGLPVDETVESPDYSQDAGDGSGPRAADPAAASGAAAAGTGRAVL